MTGWHIRAGYSSKVDKSDVERLLREVVSEVRADRAALYAEAPVSAGVRACIDSMVSGDDASITVRDDESGYECMLLASGGGDWRDAKEVARRAFVRVVMRRMHALNMDVSVTVA